ncbi:MAG: hypothetical protein F6K20_24950 [Moorea sp. SIO2C4]|nr:hypothetical protein [Moorena sp. SIO2C4]
MQQGNRGGSAVLGRQRMGLCADAGSAHRPMRHSRSAVVSPTRAWDQDGNREKILFTSGAT